MPQHDGLGCESYLGTLVPWRQRYQEHRMVHSKVAPHLCAKSSLVRPRMPGCSTSTCLNRSYGRDRLGVPLSSTTRGAAPEAATAASAASEQQDTRRRSFYGGLERSAVIQSQEAADRDADSCTGTRLPSYSRTRQPGGTGGACWVSASAATCLCGVSPPACCLLS